VAERTEQQAKKEEASSESRAVERKPPASEVPVYANDVWIQMSLWDLVMDFGVLMESSRERLRVQGLVRIAMSPQHAKVFAELLTRNIERYEKRFGPIPESPSSDEHEDSEQAT
jgi:hypothetical protein